jgi:hypothetical protein
MREALVLKKAMGSNQGLYTIGFCSRFFGADVPRGRHIDGVVVGGFIYIEVVKMAQLAVLCCVRWLGGCLCCWGSIVFDMD